MDNLYQIQYNSHQWLITRISDWTAGGEDVLEFSWKSYPIIIDQENIRFNQTNTHTQKEGNVDIILLSF